MLFAPQHQPAPLATAAQVFLSKAAIAIASTTFVTRTTPGLSFALPSPSVPRPLSPQQTTSPPSRSAQVWWLPATTRRAPETPGTAVGVSSRRDFGCPHCARLLLPQQRTSPASVTRQACSSPTATLRAPLESGTTTGDALSAIPSGMSPQQATASSDRAQVVLPWAATSTTSRSPATSLGLLGSRRPFEGAPSCICAFSPQHLTPPVGVRAQACALPKAICLGRTAAGGAAAALGAGALPCVLADLLPQSQPLPTEANARTTTRARRTMHRNFGATGGS